MNNLRSAMNCTSAPLNRVHKAPSRASDISAGLNRECADRVAVPIQRLICRGDNVDIATFRFTPDEVARIEKIPMPWPAFIPTEGNAALVGGMPGSSRSNPSLGVVNFSAYLAVFRVDSVNDRTISMVKPPDDELTDIVGRGLPPPGFDTGGMSGGPIAALTETPAGILTWTISGVVCEGHPAFDIIQGVRADFIEGSGTIIS